MAPGSCPPLQFRRESQSQDVPQTAPSAASGARPPACSGPGLGNLKWKPRLHPGNAVGCACAWPWPQPRTDVAQRLQEAPGAPSPWPGLTGQTQKDLTADGQPA